MNAPEPAITSIVNAIEFVEQNLEEEITIADIADAVFYSLFHFCRMFNGVVHHTPYDYLIRRRLSESARELIDTDRKVIEIAFDYQFNSPETYTRAFKRMFDMQPSQWRKRGTIPRRALMPRLTRKHLRHLNKGDYLKPTLAEKPTLSLIGLMSPIKEDRTETPELWDMLTPELERLALSAANTLYGVRYYPENWEERGVWYMAAREIDSPDIVDPALVIKTIPAFHYARFVHKGRWQDRFLSLDYIYHTWLPKSGKSLACPLELECYGQALHDMDDENAEWELFIPIQ